MKNTRFWFFLSVGLLSTSVIFAQTQQTQPPANTTKSDGGIGSDLYVGDRLQPLWNLVASPTRDTKEIILKGFESGKLKLDKGGIMLLTRLAGAGTYYTDHTPGGLVDIRIRALSVLGTAGTEGAQAIEKLLTAEIDPNAMAVAFYYLGQAGDSSDQRITTICKAIRRDAIGMRSTTAALMYLDAITKLVSAASEGTPSYDFVLDILTLVIDAGYAPEIRYQAIDVLSVLSGVPT